MLAHRTLLLFILSASSAAGAQPGFEWVRDFRSTRPSSSFAGAFALDGAGGFGWDLDGDGQQELIAFNGSRLLVIGPQDQELLFADGPGSEPFKLRKGVVLRVGPNRHVVARPAASCVWCAHHDIAVVALFTDAHYAFGQEIARVTFGSDPDPAVNQVLVAGPAAVDPGSSTVLVAVSRNACHLRSFVLAVSPAGTVSLTPSAEVHCPSVWTIAGNGASLYEIRDGSGQNPEWFLFANDIRRLPDLGVAASWIATNGTIVPNRQGGTLTLQWGYAVGNHVDSTVVVNLGTASAPQYRVYAMYDNGRMFAASLAKNVSGQLALTPLFGTHSGNHGATGWGPGAEALAVGRIRGLPPGRQIANGRYAFDLDGNIVADMDAQVPDPAQRRYLVNPELWTPSIQGAIARDNNYGFEAQGTLLMQTVPETRPAASPYRGPIIYQLWMLVPGLLWAHPPTFAQGTPHLVSPYLDIDAAGNVRERISVVRTQQAISVLRSPAEQVLIPGPLTQGQRDRLLTHVQQANLMRAFDTLWLDAALGP